MREKVTVPKRKPGARKAEILDVAGDLFHRSGFHGVGMDDIGEAAGVTGPALYFHFSSKTGLLAAIMERLADELVDVDRVIAEAKGPADALRRLVAHQVEFALSQRALIAVWIRDERSLPVADQRRLRERQRHYVSRWVEELQAYNADLDPAEALSIVHGVFNFIASIAFYEPKLPREQLRDLLERKATACLLDKNGRRGTTAKKPQA
jgi:AcrR family transcriptional regulator